ncbi:MAG TPA: VIT1/CCC1 transporter family protein [Terriglobales bacterium]|nr:VIT1/CCC1 transporter family protein [Terriglobales bacterium]
MPLTPHVETHFTAGLFVRDVVIGMADGLTVPFALAAGLSGAVSSTRLIVIGGLAEIAAGSIAMGLGGYLAARGDAEHYDQEKLREEREIVEIPEAEKEEVKELFEHYGLSTEEATPVVEALSKRPKEWVDFMMRFELGLEEPDPKRAVTSASTIALSYVAGGFIPLSPYMLLSNAWHGLRWSAAVTLLALGVFGYLKATFTGTARLRGASQTMVIGGLAAGAAFVIAKLIS